MFLQPKHNHNQVKEENRSSPAAEILEQQLVFTAGSCICFLVFYENSRGAFLKRDV